MDDESNIINIDVSCLIQKKKTTKKNIVENIVCWLTPDKFDLSYFESIDDLNDQNSDFCLNISIFYLEAGI